MGKLIGKDEHGHEPPVQPRAALEDLLKFGSTSDSLIGPERLAHSGKG